MKKIFAASSFLFVFCCGVWIADAADRAFLIGISQIAKYQVLDATRQGFVDYLEEHGYKDGGKVKLEFKNAQGDREASKKIAREFVTQKADLIFTITTASSQDAAAVAKKIPILFSAVTDPVSAGLVNSLKRPGANISGTTDRSPSGKQLDLIKELVPGAESVGILYNPKNDSSRILVQDIKADAAKRSLKVIEARVKQSGEVKAAAKGLVGKADVIHIPADITVLKALDSVVEVCEENKIPLFAAVLDAVSKGAVAAVALDYYKLGRQTGAMALKILQGKAQISALPVEAGKETQLYINPKQAKKMGVKFPETVLKRASMIVQ